MAVLTLKQSVEPGSTPWLARSFAVPYFSLCLGLNVVLTSLIVVRLLYMRRRLRGLGKQHTRVYTSLAAVVVDSALPYTLVSAFVIVTIAMDDTYINYAGAFAVPMLGGVEVRTPRQLCAQSAHICCSGSCPCSSCCARRSDAASSLKAT